MVDLGLDLSLLSVKPNRNMILLHCGNQSLMILCSYLKDSSESDSKLILIPYFSWDNTYNYGNSS